MERRILTARKHRLSPGLLAILLAGLVLFPLNGCYQAPATSLTGGNHDNGTAASQIVMTYLHSGKLPPDLDDVIAAVNAISIPAINVEIVVRPLPIFETGLQYPLLIGTGERIDLMCIVFQDVTNFARQGLLKPLEQLVADYAPYISEAETKYSLFDGSRFDGSFYSVSTINYVYGSAGGYLIKSSHLARAGLDTRDRQASLAEIGGLLGAIKAIYPDSFPNALKTSGQKTSRFGYTSLVDVFGPSGAAGALLDTESTTIVNLFASEAYRSYLAILRDWHLKGYTNPDAAVSDVSEMDRLINGIASGMAMISQPVIKSDVSATVGEAMTMFTLTDIYLPSQGMPGVSWAVPVTSADPVNAIRFLDLMFSNPKISNTLLWGIEGRHYIVEDADRFLIRFPDGVDADNSGYFNTYGLYGNRLYEYIWDIENDRETNAAYTARARANPTRAAGYIYDSTKMLNRIAAVEAVLAEYLPALESGSASIDVIYPVFISKLQAAGISQIIADNQAQFDAWLQATSAAPYGPG